SGQSFQPLERNGEVRTALVIRNGVNFVDDDSFDIVEDAAAFFCGQQDVERLWRGDQDVRRMLQHGTPLGGEAVAGAHSAADFGHQEAAFSGELEDFAQRAFQVFLDVVAECLERGYVDDFDAIFQLSGKRFAHEAVDAGEEG